MPVKHVKYIRCQLQARNHTTGLSCKPAWGRLWIPPCSSESQSLRPPQGDCNRTTTDLLGTPPLARPEFLGMPRGDGRRGVKRRNGDNGGRSPRHNTPQSTILTSGLRLARRVVLDVRTDSERKGACRHLVESELRCKAASTCGVFPKGQCCGRENWSHMHAWTRFTCDGKCGLVCAPSPSMALSKRNRLCATRRSHPKASKLTQAVGHASCP